MIRDVLGTGKTFRQLSVEYSVSVRSLQRRIAAGEQPPVLLRPSRESNQSPRKIAMNACAIKYIDELRPCKRCGSVVKYTRHGICADARSHTREN